MHIFRIIRRHMHRAFSAGEFTIVFGLLVLISGVFLYTSKNLRINASLLSRTPSISWNGLSTAEPSQRATSYPIHNDVPLAESGSSSSSLHDAAQESCSFIPALGRDGALTPSETTRMDIEALGSESTFGYRGPKVAVTASVSLDGGITWKPLFQLKEIRGGEKETIDTVPGGSRILFRMEGRYGWSYQKKVTTGESDPHVRIITAGDRAPSLSMHSLKPFMTNIITADGHLRGTPEDLYMLTELDENVMDFQDAVLKLHFLKESCSSANHDS